MRLLAVSHTGLFSGAETVLVRTLRAAAGAGWTVRCAAPPGPLADVLADARLDRIPLPELKLGTGSRPRQAAVLARASTVAARRLRHAAAGADLILANGLQALLPLRLARPTPPVAWLVHDVLQREDRLRYLRASGRVVDLAIAVSHAVRAPLEALGIPTTVVRNGTPWPVEPAPASLDRPLVVGCNAQLTSWKGQDVLLEAVARLGRDDVVVELLGGAFPKDGAYVHALEQRAAAPDLSGQVRFTGYQADPAARMRTWTVAVSASVDPEAAPLSVLEAMSLGLPMVGTDHGGTPEVLGKAGLLVPPRDPDAMAAALRRLLTDADTYDRCARAGPVAIAAGLTLEHQERALLRTLASLADGQPAATDVRSVA